MAELDTGGGGGHGKHEKRRAKKSSTRIDMTPMVDLAFLLLTFFVLTSTFSKPTTMEITMPVDDSTLQKKVDNAITIMLTENDKIYYYIGELKESTEFTETTFDPDKGIRKVLLDLNKDVIKQVRDLEKELALKMHDVSKDSLDAEFKRRRNNIQGAKGTLNVIIKADKKAKYRNVVDMLDEMSVAEVGKYALVDISKVEQEALLKYK